MCWQVPRPPLLNGRGDRFCKDAARELVMLFPDRHSDLFIVQYQDLAHTSSPEAPNGARHA